MFRHHAIRSRLIPPLSFIKVLSFTTANAAAAAVMELRQNNAVSQILGLFNSYPVNWSTTFLFKYIKNDVWFKNEVFKLCASETDAIIQELSSEHAIRFFYLLEIEFGVKHSIDSKLVIAHHLAEKGRFRGLRFHLQRVLQEEGYGSATTFCDILLKRFMDWESNHLVWDMVSFVYSRTGLVHDALFIFNRMKELGMQPSIVTYNSLLHNFRHDDKIRDAYGDIKATGACPTEFTISIILDGLCRQSLFIEAISFLMEIGEKDAEPCVVWFNTLMSGFCRTRSVGNAKSFFSITFKLGLGPDAYSYNILINGLCAIGAMEEALGFTIDMEKHGLGPDEVTYNILANGFSLLGMKDGILRVPTKMLCTESNLDILTYYRILICGNWQSGSIEEGFRLRDEMLLNGLRLNKISYSVLFCGLYKSGKITEALRLSHEIANFDLQPDLSTYSNSMLNHGLSKLGEVQITIPPHKDMCVKRIMPNPFPPRSTLLGLCEKRTISEARCYFNTLTISEFGQSVVLYNIMINKYVKVGHMEEAEDLYKDLLEKGISPTVVTFNSLINGWLKSGRLAEARKWFYTMKLHNLEPTIVTYTTLMNAFSEENNLKAVCELFKEIVAKRIQPNQVTYTVYMKALFKQGKLEESLGVLKTMLDEGISADRTTYNYLIQCFCQAKDIRRVDKLYNEMIRHNIQPDGVTHDILINGLCVNGNLNRAERVFCDLRDRNVSLSKVAYTTLIKAICVKGDIQKAKVLFHQMAETGFKISVRDYSAVINRLCKRSLPKDAVHFLRLMLVDGVFPDQELISVFLQSFDKVGYFSSKRVVYVLMIKCGFDQG